MFEARSEQEIFGELESVCSSPGYIHVLAYFSWRDNYLTYSAAMTADDMLKSYAPSRLIRTELSTLIGLMVKAPLDFGLPDPQSFQSLADQTERLLEELHTALNAPMMASFTPERIASKISPFTRADVLREPIFYGGESAYSFQYRDFARQRYSRVREADGLPKFGVNLRTPWTHDSRMDELTRGMARDGNAAFVGGKPRRVKVGRNDPCPCGSGKKYKKCCLN